MHFWTVPFSANDREYEARVTFDGSTFRVRAFIDGKPANGFEYSVTMQTAMDIRNIEGVDAVGELIRTAEDHVRRGL